LMVAGVWTEACIAATVRDALALGFRVLVVKDACASGTEAMHQTAILNLANRLYGGAVHPHALAGKGQAADAAAATPSCGSCPPRPAAAAFASAVARRAAVLRADSVARAPNRARAKRARAGY